MHAADWYFDFISPYSWLALVRLDELPADLKIRHHPVLFAGLLEHWGQKGPAEIAGKRVWTYRSCAWWAARYGVSFRMPAAHPFNSLPYLRLAIAADADPAAIRRIFEALWTTAADPADPALVDGLAAELGIDPGRLAAADVKDRLRRNTEEAVQRGVFGVPTLVIDGEPFWGADAIDFARDFLADPSILRTPEMRRIGDLPVAANRRPR
ncbi:2-hydroxychromene-2-carboxylate isomerase [Candidatus Binatia bacterium]|nr:2-hydroxychromene-2-carboxylate isomerase [Candidatus Binatia bacterium]